MNKIIELIEKIFGTKNNIFLKFNLSLLFSGILFMIFAIMTQQSNAQATNVFTYISSILIAFWFILTQGNNSVYEFVIGVVRLFVFFLILIFSLNFCINLSIATNGYKLIVYSILSCIGITSCLFYLISKFIDIYNFTKKILYQVKDKLFGSIQTETNKVKTFIENVTAFLTAILGFAVALKAIVEPLINLFK